jgi:hypothetical protein
MIASQEYQGGPCFTSPEASRLRRLRRERALSQRDLARAAGGVELDAVNRIECGGEMRCPRLSASLPRR